MKGQMRALVSLNSCAVRRTESNKSKSDSTYTNITIQEVIARPEHLLFSCRILKEKCECHVINGSCHTGELLAPTDTTRIVNLTMKFDSVIQTEGKFISSSSSSAAAAAAAAAASVLQGWVIQLSTQRISRCYTPVHLHFGRPTTYCPVSSQSGM
jgi:hypothetical protein